MWYFYGFKSRSELQYLNTLSGDGMNKWYYVTVIVITICYSLYKMEELYFDRMEILQKQSQVVVER